MPKAQRSRSLTVSADGANNQTAWCGMRAGGVATIEVPGTMSATVTLERRGADNVVVPVTDNSGNAITFTKAGTYTVSPQVAADYRLNCKSGSFTTGPFTMLIEGR